MSIIHLTGPIYEPTGRRVPLCGRADWDDLTDDPSTNECWECASIAGVPQPGEPMTEIVGFDTPEQFDDALAAWEAEQAGKSNPFLDEMKGRPE
jgi:hypothetical protein